MSRPQGCWVWARGRLQVRDNTHEILRPHGQTCAAYASTHLCPLKSLLFVGLAPLLSSHLP